MVDPDEVFLLDADAEQVALLEAVRRGETVVVDAGPGTGKSQTVANVVADAIDRGERVLVVAETGGARRETIRAIGGVDTQAHGPRALPGAREQQTDTKLFAMAMRISHSSLLSPSAD